MFRFIFNVRSNAATTFSFLWTDESGTPVNLSGSLFLLSGKEVWSDTVPAFTLDDTDIVVDGVITNKFSITFPPNLVDMSGPLENKAFVADLLRKVGSDPPETVGYGTVVFMKGITAWPP